MGNNYVWTYNPSKKLGKTTVEKVLTVVAIVGGVLTVLFFIAGIFLNDTISEQVWFMATGWGFTISLTLAVCLSANIDARKNDILHAFGMDSQGRLFYFNLNDDTFLATAGLQQMKIYYRRVRNGIVAAVRLAEEKKKKQYLLTAVKSSGAIEKMLKQNLAQRTGIQIYRIESFADHGAYMRIRYTFLSGPNNREKRRSISIGDHMDFYEELRNCLVQYMQYMQYTSNR